MLETVEDATEQDLGNVTRACVKMDTFGLVKVHVQVNSSLRFLKKKHDSANNFLYSLCYQLRLL